MSIQYDSPTIPVDESIDLPWFSKRLFGRVIETGGGVPLMIHHPRYSYCTSKKSCPILYRKFLHEMDQDLLDIVYTDHGGFTIYHK